MTSSLLPLIAAGAVFLPHPSTGSIQQPPDEPTRPAFYQADPGPLAVKTIPNHTLRDQSRADKEVPIRITYPDAEGPFPLIVFCHGAWGSKDGYQPLIRHWVGHGYVVIQPTHADSIALGNTFRDESVFRFWNDRPRDVKLVFDSLDLLENELPVLKGKIDRQRLAVAGHSFGAHTALLVGGARPRLLGRDLRYDDERVQAVMVLSGPAPNRLLNEQSFAHLKKPTFFMSGSRDIVDVGPKLGSVDDRKKAYEFAPPGDKILVWVEGLDHGFGGISGRRLWPPHSDHLSISRSVTLAFWDAYLKGNSAARAFLASDDLDSASSSKVTISRK
jgi:dienelactone hydrolase